MTEIYFLLSLLDIVECHEASHPRTYTQSATPGLHAGQFL